MQTVPSRFLFHPHPTNDEPDLCWRVGLDTERPDPALVLTSLHEGLSQPQGPEHTPRYHVEVELPSGPGGAYFTAAHVRAITELVDAITTQERRLDERGQLDEPAVGDVACAVAVEGGASIRLILADRLVLDGTRLRVQESEATHREALALLKDEALALLDAVEYTREAPPRATRTAASDLDHAEGWDLDDVEGWSEQQPSALACELAAWMHLDDGWRASISRGAMEGESPFFLAEVVSGYFRSEADARRTLAALAGRLEELLADLGLETALSGEIVPVPSGEEG